MGKNVVVVGAQWGDEGKGKVVDLLAQRVAAVVRFQGGHNAGHTLVTGDKVFKLHLIPSGILYPNVQCFVGHGVVVSPTALLEEIEMLHSQGIEVQGRLFVSAACTLILPYHVALDRAREAAKGVEKIGTTGRGIGPAYEDQVARRALRFADLFVPSRFEKKLRTVMAYHNFVLENLLHAEPVNEQQVLDETLTQSEKLKPFLEDVPLRIAKLQDQDILFEGAQGVLLDINQGTYPFVTSSNTTAGAVSTGSGLGPRHIDEVVGVVKAYTTRVGGGPFPTELHDSVGDLLREKGKEYGTTTGRSRRCGWFDAVAVRRAAQINSFSGLCITKLDVLDGLETIKICVGYRLHGQSLDSLPIDIEQFQDCEPVYEELPGWHESTEKIQSVDALPKHAKKYLERIEALVGVPIYMISSGPDRSDVAIIKHPFTE
ncbi:MAG: adenylosuccinate synthase [Gammaproteobacteria bacterium]|nr:adenylosuccinate synthase [Gammaproteobacteria bacterium]MBU1558867.1 adenylosuccinate synthase [Gammaproteobacteria bacterium]